VTSLARIRSVLSHFPISSSGEDVKITPVSGGLINQTYQVGEDFILQQVSPIFDPRVNLDIQALTQILLSRNVSVPQLIPTHKGAFWVSDEGTWRLMTRLPGRTIHQLENEAQAKAAGGLVAKFHQALSGVEYSFNQSRGAFHDTPRYMRTLSETLLTYKAHRLYDAIAPLADGILQSWENVGPVHPLPSRICHGDLKVSNLRFAEHGSEATALLDLDTLAYGTWDAEMGDAFRSWCNQAREDDVTPRWEMPLFRAALTGYVQHAPSDLTSQEIHTLVPGLERIVLELASRFACDALMESYFGWNPAIAPTRGDHNLIRTQHQVALFRIIEKNRTFMVDLTEGLAINPRGQL
jgi:Ser/Thr protein kinase RdoA (MazF antagonist)